MLENVKVCQVCKREATDMRHVTVECFYDVHEVAKHAEIEPQFIEVLEGETYWGVIRNYPAGTRDSIVVKSREKDANGIEIVHMDKKTYSIPSIRLLEQRAFSITCCKSCRAQFLLLFGEWAHGKHAKMDEDTD